MVQSDDAGHERPFKGAEIEVLGFLVSGKFRVTGPKLVHRHLTGAIPIGPALIRCLAATADRAGQAARL